MIGDHSINFTFHAFIGKGFELDLSYVNFYIKNKMLNEHGYDLTVTSKIEGSNVYIGMAYGCSYKRQGVYTTLDFKTYQTDYILDHAVNSFIRIFKDQIEYEKKLLQQIDGAEGCD